MGEKFTRRIERKNKPALAKKVPRCFGKLPRSPCPRFVMLNGDVSSSFDAQPTFHVLLVDACHSAADLPWPIAKQFVRALPLDLNSRARVGRRLRALRARGSRADA